ncbi:putative sulfate/molybdate transporter [Mycobacterium sp.]|uniref:putative sulfate/molybdate transporter n=1 Tax=Mycobacterium sp. TaxID=1785 RepID=UPI003BB5637F
MVSTARSRLESAGSPFRFDWAELAGAVGDLGVLVPIAVALIVKNGLTPTAVLLPAGLLYVVAGLVYRLPVPVQPLKAFGAIAIAHGFGSDDIAAGALLMGLIFVVLGASGLLDRVAKVFPHPIIRGIQLSVGLLFCQLAWKLVSATPKGFADHRHSIWWLGGATVVVVAAALLLRCRKITLAFIVLAVVTMVLTFHGSVSFGPSAVHHPHLSWTVFSAAAVALVLPQLPLSFANSCLATADVARTYFGDAARRVRPGRLAITFGLANLFAGAISGMPVCHGAGGMTAHRSFGARSGGAPIMLGSVLIALALAMGATLTAALSGFPVPILAGLLTVAGLLHIALLKDLRHPADWALALAVGITGFLSNLAIALVGALLIWWAVRAIQAWRVHRKGDGSRPHAQPPSDSEPAHSN